MLYEVITDPAVLAASIPGCQSLEKISDTEFHAEVKAKIGPVNATFRGEVQLSDMKPPPISYGESPRPITIKMVILSYNFV